MEINITKNTDLSLLHFISKVCQYEINTLLQTSSKKHQDIKDI